MTNFRNATIDVRTNFDKRIDYLRHYWTDISDMIAKEQSEKDPAKKVSIGLELDRMIDNYAKADLLNGLLINIPVYLT
jgi:hypothetical protein